MNKQAQWGVAVLFLFISLAFFQPDFLFSQEKRVKVIAETANVYLDPDTTSPVIETLNKGCVLSLCSSNKVKTQWYYARFKSEKSNNTKSGYIRESDIELLYNPLRTILISGEEGTPKPEGQPAAQSVPAKKGKTGK